MGIGQSARPCLGARRTKTAACPPVPAGFCSPDAVRVGRLPARLNGTLAGSTSPARRPRRRRSAPVGSSSCSVSSGATRTNCNRRQRSPTPGRRPAPVFWWRSRALLSTRVVPSSSSTSNKASGPGGCGGSLGPVAERTVRRVKSPPDTLRYRYGHPYQIGLSIHITALSLDGTPPP